MISQSWAPRFVPLMIPYADLSASMLDPLPRNVTFSPSACDAPPVLRDSESGNHLAPSPEGLTQIASGCERLLDGQALSVVRGLAAALQLPPDSGGPFIDFRA